MKKRILSFLLVAMMLVTMLPMTVFATEAEMSDEYKAILNEKGQYVVNTIVPTTEYEKGMYLFEYVLLMTDETVWVDDFTYDEETSTCDVTLIGENADETHNVEIVFNYDENVKKDIDALVTTFPTEKTFFHVKDMELINYWLTRTGNDDVDESGGGLDNFSSELKALLGNKNYKFFVDYRAGLDCIFMTERMGVAWLMHDDVAYYVDTTLGTKAEHIIYVPDETGDSPEELLAAVQKRVDEYVGEGKVTVNLGGDDLSKAMDFMDPIIEELAEELAVYDAEKDRLYAAYQEKQDAANQYYTDISMAQVRIDELTSMIEGEQNYIAMNPNATDLAEHQNLIAQYEAEKAEKQNIITEKTALFNTANEEAQVLNTEYYDYMNTEYYQVQNNYERHVEDKEQYLDLYTDSESELAFLHDAAGGCWFEITNNGETYRFIVMKDSDKMITPTYASADIATNVTVSSTDSSVPLDTRVAVDKLTSGTEYDKIMNILDVEEHETFDITLYSEVKGDYVTKLDNGNFEVKIPISDALKGKDDLVAYYVDENDEIVPYDVDIDGDYAVFATDHFSIYTIAEAPNTNAGGGVPDTGDTTAWAMWMMLLAVGGMTLLYGTKKYTCQK